jgi:hypothetical protein
LFFCFCSAIHIIFFAFYTSVALFMPGGSSLVLCFPGKGDPGCLIEFKFNGGKGCCALKIGELRIIGVVLPCALAVADAEGAGAGAMPLDEGRDPVEPELDALIDASPFKEIGGVGALSASHAKACTVKVFT